jgi:hypothetical protein
MNKSRITEPRVRKSAKSRELTRLRAARKAAERVGNQAEVDRIESILGSRVGM